MKNGTRISRRAMLRGASAIAAGAVAAPHIVRAAGPVQMVSHRYPALEYYAEKMKAAVPGTTVNTQLMPFDKANELVTIAMSSKSDNIDIFYANDSTFLTYAKNGWLRPVDDLWAKMKAEFQLDDMVDRMVQTYTYEGKLMLIPHTMNSQLMFYRKDLLDAAGKKPPTTIAEYQALAKSFHSPMRAGTINCLKPVDAGLNEAHWYINALGQGWFDKDWKPIFNQDAGVKAIEALKDTVRYAQQGYTTAANDECTIALQQDIATMGMQWATRAKSMDDAQKSRVVGKIDWVAPPQGKHRIASDGYGISAFTKQDPEVLFRILATSSNQANMRGAASLLLPPRKSLLTDEALAKENRFYPASLKAIDTGLAFPALPEFYPVGEFITRRVLQAVTGEMPVKAAMDTAAKETEDFLKGRGYYK
jgi:multiple sugar transport system substrate-binding protein